MQCGQPSVWSVPATDWLLAGSHPNYAHVLQCKDCRIVSRLVVYRISGQPLSYAAGF